MARAMHRVVVALTTSTPAGSAALWRDGEVVAELGYRDARAHAERLFGLLDELGRESLADVDAIACDVGPGSFAGLRIGLAAAKGLALAWDRPLIPVSSLEAMAAAAFADVEPGAMEDGERATVTCVLDARRGEVFVAGYDRALVEVEPARHLPVSELPGLAATTRRWCGSVALQHGLAVVSARDVEAGVIARVAAQRAGVNADSVEPRYLRAPDALPLAEQIPLVAKQKL